MKDFDLKTLRKLVSDMRSDTNLIHTHPREAVEAFRYYASLLDNTIDNIVKESSDEQS